MMTLRIPRVRNIRSAVLLAAMLAAAPLAAFAQDSEDAPPKRQKQLPEAPAKLPKADKVVSALNTTARAMLDCR